MNLALSKLIKTTTSCIIFYSMVFNQQYETSKTKLYDINDNKYISALEYAQVQNIHTSFYADKEKLELHFQKFKLLISPHSSFIRVNENLYHMYLPVIYDGNDFFIPAEPFLEIINNIGIPTAFMDSSEQYVLTTAPHYNIQSASVINKVNGTIIIIKTSKYFPRYIFFTQLPKQNSPEKLFHGK